MIFGGIIATPPLKRRPKMPPNASPDITIFVGHRTMGRFYSLLVARFMIMRNGGGVLETPSLSLPRSLSPSFFSLSSLFRDVRLIPKTLLLLSEVARDSCKHSEARNRRILESLA